MIKAVVLVPTTDNDGLPFSQSTWDTLREQLLGFGGYSLREGVSGAWVSQAKVYRDRSDEFTVSLTSWIQVTDWLTVVQWAKAAFRQEAMYIEIAGVPEILSISGTPRHSRPTRRNTPTTHGLCCSWDAGKGRHRCSPTRPLVAKCWI
jgi:hypothetical protein